MWVEKLDHEIYAIAIILILNVFDSFKISYQVITEAIILLRTFRCIKIKTFMTKMSVCFMTYKKVVVCVVIQA